MKRNTLRIINEEKIEQTLRETREDAARVRDILAKARELKGIPDDDIIHLTSTEDPELLAELFETARYIKNEIYGKRLVLFSPLYISNLCENDCAYCAFRAENRDITRRALSQPEIARETEIIVDQGHKRVLLVSGESHMADGFDYILKAIETVYSVKRDNGDIRRINVNVAPLEIAEFKRLKNAGIGTYQLFQETYHHETYKAMHKKGRKSNYDWRVTAMDRAMTAGIDDVGVGVLFGLYDWRFEILGLMQHIRHLEREFGVGPHTVSVPRLEPASGSSVAARPPCPVSDFDFKKIVAILRIAVPYTGIILSTREKADLRRDTFALGVSQISAGSRTNPGGYKEAECLDDTGQFSLGDHRPLGEVIRDVMSMGYVPSFCTGCYRLGRTGEDFMDLAKPGLIKLHCLPNGLLTLKEYLLDYGDETNRQIGEKLITRELQEIPDVNRRRATERQLKKLEEGKRDLYF